MEHSENQEHDQNTEPPSGDWVKRQLNGGSIDWAVRLVFGAILVWGLAEISLLRRDVSDNAVKIERKADEQNVPPPEVVRWQMSTERRLERIEDKLDAINGRINNDDNR